MGQRPAQVPAVLERGGQQTKWSYADIPGPEQDDGQLLQEPQGRDGARGAVRGQDSPDTRLQDVWIQHLE